MEINAITNAAAGIGLSGRATSQASPRSSTPQFAEMAGLPAQQSSQAADEARAVGRGQEATNPGSAAQAEKLEQAVRESVEKLNNFIRPYVTSLEFSIDEDLGRIVVKIMDNETDEVIKQIPSEDVLALTKALDKVAGLIVEQEA
ncbi:MAG: flagellar protein FlaG [Azoarcus sp.]|nr:flagellar protein FlaG [Azoarcus sp.]